MLLSRVENPCEANSFSVSQEIPRILWKPEVHYRVYKSSSDASSSCPSLLFLLSAILILFISTAPEFQLSFRFSLCIFCPMRTACLANFILFAFITPKYFMITNHKVSHYALFSSLLSLLPSSAQYPFLHPILDNPKTKFHTHVNSNKPDLTINYHLRLKRTSFFIGLSASCHVTGVRRHRNCVGAWRNKDFLCNVFFCTSNTQ